MRLFYDPHIKIGDKTHTLSEDESKHIIRVLRLKMGEQIGLLDGLGSLFTCELVSDNAKRCEVKIINIETQEHPKHTIHVAIAPTKLNERMEWFVEKATEIGVTNITFINCKNSERVKLNLDRLLKKAISAMKQSNRTFLPNINGLIEFDEFIRTHKNGLIAHCYHEQKSEFESVFELQNCPIVIGPEGDFTMQEIEFAEKNGFKTISLGENRLRTETAGLYACMRAKLITK
jgi:16S rRNA (uracil1498-N3)-methyltransferase